MLTDEDWLDHFAIACFRDTGDEDYIAARMAFRAALVTPSLWASHQAIEKYLKCILLLNRIKAPKILHSLRKALAAIDQSGKVPLELTALSSKFIEYLDDCGNFRYQEISTVAFGRNVVTLDRAVWELRRYCTRVNPPLGSKLVHGELPSRIRIPGGYLESLIAEPKSLARSPLIFHNAFFGNRRRRRVRVYPWIKATNAPLFLSPQILEKVRQFVHLPDRVVAGYKNGAKAP
jgi:HEPN domain-containing protein